jgi:hypothetical protein
MAALIVFIVENISISYSFCVRHSTFRFKTDFSKWENKLTLHKVCFISKKKIFTPLSASPYGIMVIPPVGSRT